MYDSSNTQTGVTGGNVQTGNPQNIGGQQNLTAPQNNIQSNSTEILNDSSVRIVDESGRALGVSTQTSTSVQTVPVSTSSNTSQIIIGASIVLIVAVFVVTWWMGRDPARSGY